MTDEKDPHPMPEASRRFADEPLPEPREPQRAAGQNAANGAVHDKEPKLTPTERIKNVLDEQQYLTGRIGETCRYICFGLLAAFYSIEDSDKGFSENLRATYPKILEIIALLAATAIVCDYLQYLSGNVAVRKAMTQNDYRYRKSWFAYKARNILFVAKQWLAAGAALLFIYMIADKLLNWGG